MIPQYCEGCGRPVDDCPGGCGSELDPPRYCAECGRRLTVQVFPTRVVARCRHHGVMPDPFERSLRPN